MRGSCHSMEYQVSELARERALPASAEPAFAILFWIWPSPAGGYSFLAQPGAALCLISRQAFGDSVDQALGDRTILHIASGLAKWRSGAL